MNDSATAAKTPASADPADIGKLLADIVEEASALIMPFWRAQVAVDEAEERWLALAAEGEAQGVQP